MEPRLNKTANIIKQNWSHRLLVCYTVTDQSSQYTV